MELLCKSVTSKIIDENSFGFIQEVLVYREYELYSQKYNSTISIRIYYNEKLLEKLKEMFNQDVKVELPDALIK